MKLSGTDTVKPIHGGTLAPGTHPVTVVSEEKLEDTDDRMKFKIVMEAIGGEEPGGRISAWWTITSGSMPFILGQLEAFGVELPEGEFDWIPLVGRNAEIVVRKEPSQSDPSKLYSEVKAYNKLDMEKFAVSSAQKAFDAEPIPGATGDEEDIPF